MTERRASTLLFFLALAVILASVWAGLQLAIWLLPTGPAVVNTPVVTSAPSDPEPPLDAEYLFVKSIVNVTSAEDLLSLLRTGNKLLLSPGDYYLSDMGEKVAGIGRVEAGTFVMSGVDGLIIAPLCKGGGCKPVRILTEDGEATVLEFRHSRNIIIDGMVLGHSPGAGFCEGNVLNFVDSRDITVSRTELFGSGAWGLGLANVTGLKFVDSNINGCTEGIAKVRGSSDILFLRSDFRDNASVKAFVIEKSSSVRFVSCNIRRNWFESGDLFEVRGGPKVQVQDTALIDNIADRMSNRDESIERKSEDVLDNFFRREPPGPEVKEFIRRIEVGTLSDDLALFEAIQLNDPEAVSAVLKRGMADINSLHRDFRMSPLMMAVDSGNLEVVRLLLEYGPDLELTDDMGMTALLMAAESGNRQAVSMLLRRGANPNAVSVDNETPLALAAANRHPAAMDKLLEYKATAGLETARAIAAEQGYDDILRVLRDAGRQP